MIGKRPIRRVIEKARSALNSFSAVQDKERALKMWQDFTWQARTLASDVEQLRDLVESKILEANNLIRDERIRAEVVQKFRQMWNRLAEFETDPNVPVTCSSCGRELEAEDYRRLVNGSIKNVVKCALCCASERKDDGPRENGEERNGGDPEPV